MVLGSFLVNNPDLQTIIFSFNFHCCYFISYFVLLFISPLYWRQKMDDVSSQTDLKPAVHSSDKTQNIIKRLIYNKVYLHCT